MFYSKTWIYLPKSKKKWWAMAPRLAATTSILTINSFSTKAKNEGLKPENIQSIEGRSENLISNGLIMEAIHPKWISNPVLVKKHNGKWKVTRKDTNSNVQ